MFQNITLHFTVGIYLKYQGLNPNKMSVVTDLEWFGKNLKFKSSGMKFLYKIKPDQAWC